MTRSPPQGQQREDHKAGDDGELQLQPSPRVSRGRNVGHGNRRERRPRVPCLRGAPVPRSGDPARAIAVV